MTPAERDALRHRYQFCCGYCGISETDVGAALTVDHFQPISRAGEDTPENWVYCCFACNRAKGDYWQPDSPHRILHPLRDNLHEHIIEQEDSTFLGLTDTGHFHIQHLRLNRPALVAHRVQVRQRAREMLYRADILQGLADVQRELHALRQLLERQLPEDT